MDGIDEYRGREFEWAVGTVMVNATAEDLRNGGLKATDLVEGAWEFIYAAFREEGLDPPSRQSLISAVDARITELRDEDRAEVD